MPNQLRYPEAELRRRAREEIRKGRLPESLPSSMWGGKGVGLSCAVCGDPIRPDQVEYEITDPRCGEVLRFHMECHTVWQLECGVVTQVDHAAATRSAC
jgi:hypothetical protein